MIALFSILQFHNIKIVSFYVESPNKFFNDIF